MSRQLIEVERLKKFFHLGRGRTIKAVNDISFSIRQGETLGLAGESGSGKSTAGRTILRLYEPTEGLVKFDGRNIFSLSGSQMKALRREMQMIFQDPYASLNPRLSVRDIIGEALDIHKLAHSKTERNKRVEALLDRVGLNPGHAHRYPHEFSGGQRQRIGIARALAVDPRFIIADEPISALDVSIQAQIVNLMLDLQRESGLAYLFITHDLSMIKHISDRVAVMYLGRLIELASSEELFGNPQHPYTQALLSALLPPVPETEGHRERIVIAGEAPDPIKPPSGCHFRTRCPAAADQCVHAEPAFTEVKPGHWTACHLI
ncbi:ABC transporter ATP-binding protein [Ferviditalea candida]|uniref:Oligopeptide/dipeptide ABC transporter ATP-binding protein n=1 Tax=Ferviditalea candida TaxID=3108399 RepID=A0ABU5ZDR4_9BACL|nr:oligopeptide/dipeptide ABC transporter ATP-binding protein [Paenibacillaceae bacterium T2]